MHAFDTRGRAVVVEDRPERGPVAVAARIVGGVMSRAKTDRAARFREILEQAAKDLGCEPTADVATHVAALRMGRETHLAKLIAGADVDPDALLRIDAA